MHIMYYFSVSTLTYTHDVCVCVCVYAPREARVVKNLHAHDNFLLCLL